MEMNSTEIDKLLFAKQMSLYTRIDNLINKRFDEIDPDILSVLTRTMMDLDDRIQYYRKGLQQREMFKVNYDRVKRKKEGLQEVDSLRLKSIMNKIDF